MREQLQRLRENSWVKGLGIWLLVVLAVCLFPMEDHYERRIEQEMFSGEETVCLYPGDYILTVEYASDHPIHLIVEDKKYVNPDHTQGKIVIDEMLPASGDAVEKISFTAESRTTMLSLYSEELLGEDLFFYVARLQSAGKVYWDKEFLVLFTALVGLLILWYVRKHPLTKEEKLAHLLLLVCVVITSWMLVGQYIPEGHDLSIHFNRIEGLKGGLLAGFFPVRIYPELMNGYGYAFPIFYPDLFLYIPAVLGTFGVSTFLGYKLLIVLINLVTAYGAWFSFSRLTKSRKTGLIAAVLYSLALYRLTDVYVRAALGEALAMAFLPLWLYSVHELLRGNHKKWLWSVVSFTCLLRSHILTTEMAVVFTVVLAGYSFRCLLERQRLFHIFVAGGSTVLLNLSFLIPFLEHTKFPYNVFQEAEVRLSEATLQGTQLFSFLNARPLGERSENILVEFSPPWTVGLGILGGCLCLLAAVILYGKKQIHGYKQGKCAALLGLFLVYMTTQWFPWDIIYPIGWLRSITSVLQFPWRLLAFATLFLSISAAYGYEALFQEKHQRELFLAVSLGFSALCAIIYLDHYYEQAPIGVHKLSVPAVFQNQVDDLYLMNYGVRGSLYRRGNLIEPEIENLEIHIWNYQNEPLALEFDYETEENQKLNLPLVYDLHYLAYDENGNQLMTYVGEKNRLGLYLEKGSGHVRVFYDEPMLYRLALLAEILMILCLAGVFGLQARRENNLRKFKKN